MLRLLGGLSDVLPHRDGVMKSYRYEYKKPLVEKPYLLKLRNVRVQRNSNWVNGHLVLRPNPLDVTTQLWTFGQIDIKRKVNGTVWRRFTATTQAPSDSELDLLASDFQRLKDEVENKLVQKVAGIRVNALEIYATRIQTANTVAKRVGQLANAMLSLKRGKWKQFKRHLGLSKNLKKPGAHKFEDIPGLWLEYSFGWAPLISDIYTILDNTFDSPKSKIEASVKRESTRPYTKSTNYVEHKGESQTLCVAKACVNVQVDVPALAALSQYGITNPLAVAWELVPYSFVVDWFLPVGDYIEQMNATAGLILSDFNITFTTTTYCNYLSDETKYLISTGFSPSDYSWPTQVPVFVKHVHKERLLYTRPPSYRFLFPEDPMKQSLRRVSYAASLLSLAFSRSAKRSSS